MGAAKAKSSNSKVTLQKLKCSKCEVEAVGCTGHVGRPHQNCEHREAGIGGQRKGNGLPRSGAGTWSTK